MLFYSVLGLMFISGNQEVPTFRKSWLRKVLQEKKD